jgi:hypothetical protein
MPQVKNATCLLTSSLQVILRVISNDRQVIVKKIGHVSDLSEKDLNPALARVFDEMRSEGWSLNEEDCILITEDALDFMEKIMRLRWCVDARRANAGKPKWPTTQWLPSIPHPAWVPKEA